MRVVLLSIFGVLGVVLIAGCPKGSAVSSMPVQGATISGALGFSYADYPADAILPRDLAFRRDGRDIDEFNKEHKEAFISLMESPLYSNHMSTFAYYRNLDDFVCDVRFQQGTRHRRISPSSLTEATYPGFSMSARWQILKTT